MLPRWFRLVVAAEIAGTLVAVVLLVHLLTSGVQAAGGVVSWARHATAPTPAPVSPTLAAPATPAPRARGGVLPPGLGSLLNRGTGGEYVGEWALVQLFETVLREQAVTLLGVPASAPPHR